MAHLGDRSFMEGFLLVKKTALVWECGIVAVLHLRVDRKTKGCFSV